MGGGWPALDVGSDVTDDIRVWDVQAETLTRLILGEGQFQLPVWSPDGSRIAYRTVSSGSIRWKAANNTGEPEVLVDSIGTAVTPAFFTADGSALVFQEAGRETNADLAMVSLASGTAGDIIWRLNGAYGERNPRLSPDDRWLAYESNESGQFEIYVRPFPDVQANQVQVSNAGGRSPIWSRDGRELFYLDTGGVAPRLMSVSFDAGPATGRFAVLSQNVVMDWPYFVDAATNYDVSLDGSRFLAIGTGAGSNSAQPAELTVVDNWFEDVRERVGGN